jgi:hypothetical protein
MSDTARRTLRTLLQGLPPAAILAGLVAFGVPLTEMQIAFLMVALTAVSSALANLVEDNTGVALGPAKGG